MARGSRRRRKSTVSVHSERNTRQRPRTVTRSQDLFMTGPSVFELFPSVMPLRPQPKAGRRVIASPNVNYARIDSGAFQRQQARIARINAGVAVKPAKEVKTVCSERRERREVLFAIGKGGGGNRPPVFTQRSKVRCK